MGMMQVKGDYSGKVYQVEFAGASPTPEEIANASGQIQALERQFETEFEDIYGDQAVDDGTGFGRGFESGLTQLRSSLGTAVRRTGEGANSDFIAGIGAGEEDAARRTQLSRAGTTTPFKTFDEAREGGVGDTLSYIGEIAGQSGPQMIAGIGAAGLATLAVPAAPITAALTASAAALFPLFYGSNIQSQESEIAAGNLSEIDNTKALQAAALQSTLNSIADKLLIGPLFNPAKKIFTRVVQGAGQGTLSEVPTEISQQVLERWQAGKPLDNPEAIAEYREVGIAAGILGGGIGSVGGVFKGPSLDSGKDTEINENIANSAKQDLGGVDEDEDDAGGLASVSPTAIAAAADKVAGKEEQLELPLDAPTVAGKAKQVLTTPPSEADLAGKGKESVIKRKIKGEKPTPITEADTSAAKQAFIDDPSLHTKTNEFIKEEHLRDALNQIYSPEVLSEIIRLKNQGLPSEAKVKEQTDKADLAKDEAYLRGTTDASIDDANAKAEADLAEEGKKDAKPAPVATVTSTPVETVTPTPTSVEPVVTDQDAPLQDGTENLSVKSVQAKIDDAKKRRSVTPKPEEITEFTDKLRRNTEQYEAEAAKGTKANPELLKALQDQSSALNTSLNTLKESPYVLGDNKGDYSYFPENVTPESKPAVEVVPEEPATVTAALSEEQPAPPITRDESGAFIGDAVDQAIPDAAVTGSPLVQSYDNSLNLRAGKEGKPFLASDPISSATTPVRMSSERIALIAGGGLDPEIARRAVTGDISDPELLAELDAAATKTLSDMFEGNNRAVGAAAQAMEKRQGTLGNPDLFPDITSFEDKLDIIELLNMTNDQVKAIPDTEERFRVQGARYYFLRFRRPAEAISEIMNTKNEANNVVKMTDVMSSKKEPALDQGKLDAAAEAERVDLTTAAFNAEEDRQFYTPLSTQNAKRAYQWMRRNMSIDTRMKLLEDYKNGKLLKASMITGEKLVSYDVTINDEGQVVITSTYDDADTGGVAKAMGKRARSMQMGQFLSAGRAMVAAGKAQAKAEKIRSGLSNYTSPRQADLDKLEQEIDAVDAANAAIKLNPTEAKSLRSVFNLRGTEERDAERKIIALERKVIATLNIVQQSIPNRAVIDDRNSGFQATNRAEAALAEVALVVKEDGVVSERQIDDAMFAELDRLFAAGEITKTKKTKEFRVADINAVRGRIEAGVASQAADQAQYAEAVDDSTEVLEAVDGNDLDGFSGVAENVYFGDGENLFLVTSEVSALTDPLRPSIQNQIANNDLQGALMSVALTSPSKTVSKAAARLMPYVGNTDVKLVSGTLTDPRGRAASGMFSPSTNTISIDRGTGMNSHTVLHEVFHAASSTNLANMKLPEVRQLKTIYEAVKKQLPPMDALNSLDEFVAEAFSNPDFQVTLAGIPMADLRVANNNITNAWVNFKTAIRRMYNRFMDKPQDSAFDRTDVLLDKILAPQLSNRAAPAMYLAATNPDTAGDLLVNAGKAVKPSTKEEIQAKFTQAKNSGVTSASKSFLYGISPLNILADTLKRDYNSDVGIRLHRRVNNVSSQLRAKTIKLDYIVNQIRNFKKATGMKQYKILQELVPTSTLNQVDPSVDRNVYASYGVVVTDPVSLKKTRTNYSTIARRDNKIAKIKAANPEAKITKIPPLSKNKLVVYDALRADYDKLIGKGAKDGQRVYRTMRNFFQETYDEIAPALKKRIESISDDEAVRKTAFDKLSELLLKDSGIIMPYFPLMRKGSYRLSYTAIDPEGSKSGGPQVDRYVEYFATKNQMIEAKQKVKDYNAEMLRRPDVIAANLGTIFDEKTGQSSPNPMLSAASMEPEATKLTPNSNYGTAPSSGFVFNVLNVLQAAGVQKMEGGKGNKVISDILDLSLDALPERSFMQGFRTRKGVRGFLGDTTPTGYSLANFDLIDMMETKGRDLNRQVVQLQGSAEIQGVMNDIEKLTKDPETAEIGDRLKKIAEFAQRPNVNRLSQVATNLGFGWTMAYNVSSAGLTFFDVGMSVMPLLQGKYGASKTAGAFADASKVLYGSPTYKMLTVTDEKGNKVKERYELGAFGRSLGNVDYDDPASVAEGMRKYDVLASYAVEQAQMGQSLTQETLEIDMITGDTGSDVATRNARMLLETSQKWGGAMFHHSERYGREVSLIAAYDLEIDKISNGGKKTITTADKQAAAEAAVDFVEFTLGGTASAGRPVYAQGPVGNVLFLFKRFAISKYYMMARMTEDATRLKPRNEYDTEEAYQEAVLNRKIARQQLASFLITVGLIAGYSGMPLFGELGIMYDAISDDDDDNWDTAWKKWTGDPLYGGLVGMSGLAIGERIALNNMLYRPPLIEKEQNALWTIAEQLGGPVIGITSQWSRGGSLWSQGEYQRSIEAIAPAAVRNALKAGRYATEGNLTMRGNEITSVSPFTIAGQLMGFSGREHIDQLNMNRNERTKWAAMQDRKKKILRRANMAREEGDVEGLRRAYKESLEHNARLPQGAEKLLITTESFKNSYRNFERNTGAMVGGMIYTPSMRRSAAEYSDGLSSLGPID